MHLIYLDESGYTGNNLQDPGQPILVLGALIVPETKYLALETELSAAIEKFFPSPRPEDFEIHATELLNPRDFFRSFSIQHRLDFYRSWMEIAARHELKFMYRAIIKKRFATWLHSAFGSGIVINPHVAAFALVAQVVNDFLRSATGSPLGIFISDENKEVMHDVEKSIRLLRGDEGALRLSQIIEKGFFIESHKSLLLQLCDICAHAARRTEEEKGGVQFKELYKQCLPWLKPLVHRGNELLPDVLAWLQQQQKKGAARG